MPDLLSPILPALTQLLGRRLTSAPDDLKRHAGDASHHLPHPPAAVAYAQSTDEVSQIVQLCALQHIPVIPYGTGTAVEGGIIAHRGGLCLDLSRMDRILQVHTADMDATVQAGVTRNQLNEHLIAAATQLLFPVDPGADASLGGMAATRASGSAAVGYGTMRENVLALEAVLADGQIVRTGTRARKSAAGYDLTRLLVGSEGTLGIITEVTLRLVRKPQAVSAAVCAFADIGRAVDAVIAILSQGVPLARIELLDEIQIGAINRYSGLTYQLTPALFFEFHGTQAGVAEQAQTAATIIESHGGEDFQWAAGETERDRLWQARYDGYHAARALRPGSSGYVTDVCVPISRLAEAIRWTKTQLASSTLIAPLFGHVGDGNFHVVFLIDPANPDELAEVKTFGERLVEKALELDGTCTGEHGIGIGKLDALERECGEAVQVMRAIKQALDPHNILNPGKVLKMA